MATNFNKLQQVHLINGDGTIVKSHYVMPLTANIKPFDELAEELSNFGILDKYEVKKGPYMKSAFYFYKPGIIYRDGTFYKPNDK